MLYLTLTEKLQNFFGAFLQFHIGVDKRIRTAMGQRGSKGSAVRTIKFLTAL